MKCFFKDIFIHFEPVILKQKNKKKLLLKNSLKIVYNSEKNSVKIV